MEVDHVLDLSGPRPVVYAAACLRCGHRHQLDGWAVGSRVRVTRDGRGLAVTLRGDLATVVGQSFYAGPLGYVVDLDRGGSANLAPCDLEDE